MSELGVDDILAAAQQSLDFAEQGARDYLNGEDRRVSGFYMAAISGRIVTFTLQNLRGKVPEFDLWYEPIRQGLRDNLTAQWFKDVRNRIEKQGGPGNVSTSVDLNQFSLDSAQSEAPPGTVEGVIGDVWGRSYWIVRLQDKSEMHVYFSLPAEVAGFTVTLEGAPGGRDVGALLKEYLQVLREIVASARAKFT